MHTRKMVLIGAGSAMFTQGLVMDLLKNAAGAKWHLALCDTNEEVLRVIVALVKKMIAYGKKDIQLSYSTDRKELLQDADYVVITIGVGSRKAWEQDVFIPRKYGVFQPVGDTAMPGGISRAMSMIPAMLDIMSDVERICPNAHVFNYANPMAMICRAVYKKTNQRMTGLCIGVPAMEWYLADVAGLEREKVTSRGIGINHLTFIYDFRYNGKSAWDTVRKAIEHYDLSVFSSEVTDAIKGKRDNSEANEPFSWTFFKQFGAFPAPGDRHVTEFFTERFPEGKYFGKMLGVDAYSFEGTINEGETIHKKAVDAALSEQPLTDEFFTHFHGEHEQLMEIITSIEFDQRKVFYANLPNKGAVPNLPYDAVIELPAIASATGFCPTANNDYPDVLAAIIMKNLGIVELAVESALNGDVRLFEEAILLDQLCNVNRE